MQSGDARRLVCCQGTGRSVCALHRSRDSDGYCPWPLQAEADHAEKKSSKLTWSDIFLVCRRAIHERGAAGLKRDASPQYKGWTHSKEAFFLKPVSSQNGSVAS